MTITHEAIERLEARVKDADCVGLKLAKCHAADLRAALDALEKMRAGPGDDEHRIHLRDEYRIGLLCGVEDRDFQANGYGAVEYGFNEGVDAVLEWLNGLLPAAFAAQEAKP